jgi:ABC-type branched-subunit amino acid transport system substrate-binding protein
LNIPVFAFSNDKKVAGNGVYLLGLMPDQQTERLVIFAMQNGIDGFAATVPQNVLGTEVEQMLKSSARINRKQVYFTENYSSLTMPDYNKIAESIAKKFAKQGDLSNKKHALIMPEAAEPLKRLLSGLAQNQITSDNVRFIGTASWDNPETLMLPELNNAWYSAVPFDGMNSFMTNFQENFGYRPPQLASLSYDAVLLIAELGKDGLYEGAIIRQDGFFGANGAYRFLNTGISERGYDVMEVSNGSVTIIDPAQKFF